MRGTTAVRTAVVLLAFFWAIAGCAPGVEGPWPAEPASAPGSGAADGGDRTRTLPPGFIECPDGPPKDGELVAEVDLRTLSAPAPTGFRPGGTLYYEDHPVEGDYEAQYWVPQDQQHPLDVLNLVVYPQLDLGPLTLTCDMLSWREITQRIERYHELNGAEVIEETSRVTVAGLPAVREEVDLPSSGYRYLGYWIFGRGQVAHLYCQWAQDEATMRRGCQEYIDSVTVE